MRHKAGDWPGQYDVLGCVYFIRGGDYIKIGWTGDAKPRNRVRALQNGNPHILRVIGTIDNQKMRDERNLHVRFSAI